MLSSPGALVHHPFDLLAASADCSELRPTFRQAICAGVDALPDPQAKCLLLTGLDPTQPIDIVFSNKTTELQARQLALEAWALRVSFAA
jgi:hypothetical protein